MTRSQTALALVAGLALALPIAAQVQNPAITPSKPASDQKQPATVDEQIKNKQKFIADEFARKQAEAQQAPVPGAVGIKFDNQAPDLGKVSDDAPVPYKFTFSNISDKTVTITNVTPGCGCTATNFATMKKTYAPGEKGELEITFNPANKRGIETKHVTVDTDFSAGPRVELNFKVEVQPRLTVEPMSITMVDVRQGTPATQTLVVTGRQPGFDVTKWDIQDADITVTRLDKQEVKEGDDTLTRISFQVTASDKIPMTGLGRKSAMLNLTTTDPKKSLIPVGISISVVGAARVLPERIPVRTSNASEPWVREVRIENRDNKLFEITSIDTDANADMHLVFDADPTPPGPNQSPGYKIKVSGTGPVAPGPISAKMFVHTTLAENPVIEVPIGGAFVVMPTQVNPIAAPPAQGPIITPIQPPVTVSPPVAPAGGGK